MKLTKCTINMDEAPVQLSGENEVPADFVDDGCSCAPDGYWRRACRIHDWRYHQIRPLAMEARHKLIAVYLARKRADQELMENMRRSAHGRRHLQMWANLWISRRFYRVLRVIGWRALFQAGHPGNRMKTWKS